MLGTTTCIISGTKRLLSRTNALLKASWKASLQESMKKKKGGIRTHSSEVFTHNFNL
jgi:hypothetical protein